MQDEARDLAPEQQVEQQVEQIDPLVKQLRNESARYRVKAREARELAEQRAAALFTALVRLDGRLADPSDLPYSEKYLTDETALEAAISDLLERKPGLAARQYRGNIGAGIKTNQPTSLIELMRGY